MKTKGKAWQLVVTALLIVVFVYTAFFGVAAKYGDVTTTYIKGAKDIRFGVDIKGGVNVTFVPSDGYDATDEQLDAARLVIENRLVALNVTDYELYVDNNSDSLILEFPWQSGETDFDPESAIQEIGTTAYLTFREGASKDGELILDGSMVESASAQYGAVSNGGSSEYYVALKFTTEGAKAFGDATTKLAADKGSISIWLDDENVSTATVNTAITDGQAIITSSASNPFTQDAVVKMARQINSGALPFALSVDSYSTVSPSLGENSLGAMVLAGLIAFALIVVFMTVLYRLPGFLACIALAGQVAATLAFVSGYFSVFESFTLTLPGIAGIILAIGMGVDANVITAERIKEELKNGKSLDGALKSGFARGLTPIIDGNVTIVIVAIVLMGAFGPSDGLFAKALHFVFFAFGPSTAGTIYAFGYTLLTGVLLNFVFGVFATRVMIRGAAAIKALRYGLLGSNGAGKSTTMNIMCGVLRQSEGDVYIKGISMSKNPVEAKRHIGFLPQNPPLHMDLTVTEYLEYCAALRYIPDREIPQAVKKVLERCGISHFSKRLLRNLSGGYQQRVGIAQAIIHNPDFVVLDEPTNGLDPNQILDVRHLIKEIAEEHTVLISTHILSEVQAVCDHIRMIEQGRLVFAGTVEEFDNYIVPDSLFVSLMAMPAIEDLKRVPGVLDVEELGGPNYRIKYKDFQEVTERLVEASSARCWGLTELRQEKSSMNDIFAELSRK